MKYAVYVEGQSEMLFVADVLQKYSDYDPVKCGFRCINLNADIQEKVSYPIQGDRHSENFNQIINVNNDNLVASRIKKDSPGLIAQGFDVILGLRDVYGDTYKRVTKNQRIISRQAIEAIHKAQSAAIGITGHDCRLHFAIMEYEAWMLAMIEPFASHNSIDIDSIDLPQGFDITCDFEQMVYHPFPIVRKIFNACGEDYHKHGKESYSFLATLSVADYEALRHSGRCPSFSKFIDSLLGGQCPDLP